MGRSTLRASKAESGGERRRSGSARSIPAPAGGARVGQSLGPYRLCYPLGAGGMATVFLARANGYGGFHRFAAVKCIQPPHTNNKLFVEMFLDEARIASLIHHPHVCNVFDFDVKDGIYYMAMEYLAGETLKALWQAFNRDSKPLEPLRRAGLIARIIADAALGLHAAHELRDVHGTPLNVVHRDVSPENIFVTYDGTTKIMDFGVATAARQTHDTRSGVVKGKLSYVQPEVLAGGRPDRRADVWGLGAVMWELLTGKRLFHRESDSATLQAVNGLSIPPPSQVASGIPRELDQIALRALARPVDERFASAREMSHELTQFLASRKLAIGLPEVGELMEGLFPDSRARRKHLLELFEEMDQASTEIVINSQSMEVVGQTRGSRSRRPAARAPSPPVSAPVAEPAPAAADTVLSSSSSTTRTRISRSPLVLSGAAVALSLASFLSQVIWLHGTEPDAPRRQETPRPPATAPDLPTTSETTATAIEMTASVPIALPADNTPEGRPYLLEVTPAAPKDRAQSDVMLRLRLRPAPGAERAGAAQLVEASNALDRRQRAAGRP